MTIVTKPLSDKKQDQLKKPLVAAGADTNSINADVESAADASYVVPRSYCFSDAGCLCLFLTALIVVGAGIVGGFSLYHHLAPPHHRLQGWFQPPQQMPQFQEPFSEEFDIDIDQNREDIKVPRFGEDRRGRFVHDFSLNKTGIVDVNGGRCFLMPLDTSHVLPPRSLMDLINKVWSGYYEVDTEIIRETYEVEFPPVSNIKEMGLFIYKECRDMPTYRLKRVDFDRFRRSLHETEQFLQFAGKKMTRVRILMDGVNEYERDHPRVEN